MRHSCFVISAKGVGAAHSAPMQLPFEATRGAAAKKRTPSSGQTIGESLTLHMIARYQSINSAAPFAIDGHCIIFAPIHTTCCLGPKPGISGGILHNCNLMVV